MQKSPPLSGEYGLLTNQKIYLRSRMVIYLPR